MPIWTIHNYEDRNKILNCNCVQVRVWTILFWFEIRNSYSWFPQLSHSIFYWWTVLADGKVSFLLSTNPLLCCQSLIRTIQIAFFWFGIDLTQIMHLLFYSTRICSFVEILKFYFETIKSDPLYIHQQAIYLSCFFSFPALLALTSDEFYKLWWWFSGGLYKKPQFQKSYYFKS